MPPPAEPHTGAESSEDAAVDTEDGEGAEEGLGRDGARVSSAAAGRDGGVAVGAGTPPPACCSVCMEPWTCNDAHRICCIPCGHVYGRSCLERWLQCCGNMNAKCPQCREQFELKHIIDLYAPGNMWDGCCRIQEIKAHFIAEVEAKLAVELPKMATKLRSELEELYGQHIAELLSDLTKAYQNSDVGAMVKSFVSMKEQMKKMVEQNATPMDLIEFMEHAVLHPTADSKPPTT